MTPSKTILDFIKGFEACRLNAYLPTLHDVPTIGWGATGKDIHLGLVWNQGQCDTRFYGDVMQVSTAVTGMLGSAVTTQNQFDAMVSFAYNEGAQRLHDSFILSFHLLGRDGIAAAYFMHYTKQKGIVLKGLVRRRKAEMALYLKPQGVTP